VLSHAYVTLKNLEREGC